MRNPVVTALPFGLVYVIPASVVAGVVWGGVWVWLAGFIAFVLVPAVDLLVGEDQRNPTVEETPRFERSLAFRLVTWLCAPIQVAVLLYAMHAAMTQAWSAVEWTGLAISTGLCGGGMGITVAHELIHRHNRWEPRLGRLILLTVGYVHWAVEHVSGHHANVATPKDPATARRGQSFYRFLLQTIPGTAVASWRLHADRLKRKGLPVWSWRNRWLRDVALQVVVVVAVGLWLGPGGLAFFAIQALVAIGLLEVVNYLEHYGLERKPTGDGRWERVQPQHSWNASHWLTNHFLFHLQRHSDHHAWPGRRYPVLRHDATAPQLPTGYSGMVLLALVPPLWFRVMDSRLPDKSR